VRLAPIPSSRRVRSTRLTALAALALAGTTLVVPAGAAAKCDYPMVAHGPQIASIVPPFPADNINSVNIPIADSFLDQPRTWPPAFNDAAVDPARPNQMYMVNSDTVLRTQDGGCHWIQVYHLPHQTSDPTQPSAELDRIMTVAVGRGAVFLTTSPIRSFPANVAPGLGRVHVMRSTDDGNGFDAVDAGITPFFGDALVVPAPSDPRILYLSARVGLVNVANQMFRSDDGGSNWTAVNGTTAPTPAGCCWVDPLNPKELWARPGVADTALATAAAIHSVDGGTTFTTVPQSVDTADVYQMIGYFHAKGQPARVLAVGEKRGPKTSTQTQGPVVERFLGYADNGGQFRRLPKLPLGASPELTVEAVFSDRADQFTLVLRKATPEGNCFHLYSFNKLRPSPWRQLTTFIESPEPGTVYSCSGELFATSGRQPIVRELVSVGYSSEQSYIVGYRGER
jgi:hypothetical protein